MCDIVYAAPRPVPRSSAFLGKNSDRQRNEAQAVELRPAATYGAGDMVSCTYLTIPQAAHTHATLLCRPYWMWGAEMGANALGLVIGNEGLFARTPAPRVAALTGMDLLRLALERARTAAQACDVIADLLTLYGQGGNCGHLEEAYYHNSFLIADPRDAFVLETVGRDWMIKRVTEDRALSNAYTIDRPDACSAGIGDQISGAASAADALADPAISHIGSALGRRQRGETMLRSRDGAPSVRDIFTMLRDHDPDGQDDFTWADAGTAKKSLCIHAGDRSRIGQTTGSLVSEMGLDRAVHWVTGTSAPCLSIFKPVVVGAPLPAAGLTPTKRFNAETLWWRHEAMHRRAITVGLGAVVADVAAERDALEADFVARMDAAVAAGSSDALNRTIADCWREADATEHRWSDRIAAMSSETPRSYHEEWRRLSNLAGMPGETAIS